MKRTVSRGNVVRWILLGALIVAVVLVLGWRLTTCAPSGTSEVAPRIGYAAPDFSLATLGGAAVTLSELSDRWVVVTFWATWCPACIAQQPYLQAAFEEMSGGIEFVAINLGESEDVVRNNTSTEITYTIALDGRQTTGSAYNVRYLPTTFLIDDEGVIRAAKVGGFRSKQDVTAWLDQAMSG